MSTAGCTACTVSNVLPGASLLARILLIHMLIKGKAEQINHHVWKLKQNNRFYSVKQYDSQATLYKVNQIHEQLKEIGFSHMLPVVKSDYPLLFVQPWLARARSVNFKKRNDRVDSLAALRKLHATGGRFDWKSAQYLHHYPLALKWEDRLFRFQSIRKACEVYIGKNVVEDIIFYAESALRMIKKMNRSTEQLTLLHGDVVHHNLLRDGDGFIRLIDFDLASIGDARTEIALWMHRVLPQIDYDLPFLINEHPYLQTLDESTFYLLLYPNELLREWLHFFSLSSKSRERQLKHILPFTKDAHAHWPKLWYNIEQLS